MEKMERVLSLAMGPRESSPGPPRDGGLMRQSRIDLTKDARPHATGRPPPAN